MKCDSYASSDSTMSAENCSLKLRFLILVINTANLINERATPSFGISHALTAPTTFFTTYIFIGVFVFGALRKHYASWFLQIYALVACCSIQISLSFVVFNELKATTISQHHASFVLNGVLPMINAVLLLVDLTGIIFSNRQEIGPPSIPTTSTSSQPELLQ